MPLQNACSIFPNLYIPTCMRKIFKFMVFTFLENALNICILLMPKFPTQNSRQDFWKISFPQDERGGENYDLHS